MKEIDTKSLCIKGLLTALVMVTTMVVSIPVPATNGYIHLGDSIIILSSIFFGWEYGLVAGALGSSLADILTGYTHWAPFTLLIKGFMGYVSGKISTADKQELKVFSIRNILAALSAIFIMVIGYLIGGTLLKGSFLVALTSVLPNLVQGIGGLIIYFVLGTAFIKSNILKYLNLNNKAIQKTTE